MLGVSFKNRCFSSIALLILMMATFHQHSFVVEKKRVNEGEGIGEDYLRSITFIVDAQTADSSSEFHSLTQDVFLTNELYKTEFVVSVSSLSEISDYLDKTKPFVGGIWSRVDIVAHSSVSGLTVPIASNDDRLASIRTLKEVVASEPETRHIDDSTVITVWACGLGKYADYLSVLKQFFKGSEGSPIIRSPKLNTHFSRDIDTGKAFVFFAQEYYIYSLRKMADDLAKEFNHLHGDKVDWLQALNNNETIVGSNNFSEQRKASLKIAVDRTWLEEYKTIEELVSTLELADFTLASQNLNVTRFKWKVENHQQPENVTLVGRSQKVSVFVPKPLLVEGWGRI